MSLTRWRWIPLFLVLSSVALHFVTVLIYSWKPDKLATFTVFPFWMWCLIGIALAAFGFLIFKKSLGLCITALWLLTLLLGSDESSSLGNFNAPRLTEQRPAITDPSRLLRVLTLNCAGMNSEPWALIKSYDPDIIFLQEISHPYQLRQLVSDLYGDRGDYRFHRSNAIVTRGKIEREIKNSYHLTQHLTTRLADGSALELINVHLPTAETRLDLWSLDCWRAHTQRRRLRRSELSIALQILEKTSKFPNHSAIVAGDFNAPASDAVYDLMRADFNDAFTEAGRGWGNTYHAKFPVLRIDHIFATRHFTPRSATTRLVPGSDHKMVVTDLLLN